MSAVINRRPKGAATEQDRIADARRMFQIDTEGMALEVVLDQGVHRHLRFRAHGRSLYWFDIHTSPGLLVFHGDAGNWMFSRVEDMLTFFRGGPVNPGYWGEKVVARDRHGDPQTYDRLLLLSSLKQHAIQYATDTWERPDDDWADPETDDWQERRAGFYRAVVEELVSTDELAWDRGGEPATGLLMNWQYEERTKDSRGLTQFRRHTPFSEAWDWGPHTGSDHLFLWCLHAIVWGIEQYDAAKSVG